MLATLCFHRVAHQSTTLSISRMGLAATILFLVTSLQSLNVARALGEQSMAARFYGDNCCYDTLAGMG